MLLVSRSAHPVYAADDIAPPIGGSGGAGGTSVSSTNPNPPKSKAPPKNSPGMDIPIDIDKWEWVTTSPNPGETAVPIVTFAYERRIAAGSLPLGVKVPMKLSRNYARHIYYAVPNPKSLGKTPQEIEADIVWLDGDFIKANGPIAEEKLK